jgi:hypothetical protein
VSITDWAPKTTGERLFPTCADFCAWHYAEDTKAEPGVCWADDVLIPGAVEVMATSDAARTDRPPLSITAFRADVPSHDDGITFTDLDQAEATAHALLAMVARLRGDEQLASAHIATGLAVRANQTAGSAS